MIKNHNLQGSAKENYISSLKPFIEEIKRDILPKIDGLVVSKEPAYYGISYKEQVELAVSGDLDALRHVGTLLYNSPYIPNRKKLALSLLEAMAYAPNDSVSRKINLPSAYLFAKYTLKDKKPTKAINILKPLIEANFSPAMALMGNIHQYGSGVEASYDEANKFYKAAQSHGNIYATALRAKLDLKHGSILKKVVGVLLFLRFIWQSMIYHFFRKTDIDNWEMFY